MRPLLLPIGQWLDGHPIKSRVHRSISKRRRINACLIDWLPWWSSPSPIIQVTSTKRHKVTVMSLVAVVVVVVAVVVVVVAAAAASSGFQSGRVNLPHLIVAMGPSNWERGKHLFLSLLESGAEGTWLSHWNHRLLANFKWWQWRPLSTISNRIKVRQQIHWNHTEKKKGTRLSTDGC